MTSLSNENDETRTISVLTKGTMVSHYRIVEKIGAGGMGEVYLAEDTKLKRQVALKFLPPQYAADPDFKARFVREAEATAKLNHPNIITIHDVAEHQGRPFFAMELVEGQSLREMSKGKVLSVERVVELAIQICDGLSAAQEKKVVHRDIKPSNIVIDAYGRPKILDFGLAAIQGGEHLTKTGSTLGTVRYMSPEQVQGQEVDQRSDLFSLGVVLYELIAGGRTPFERDNEAATLNATLKDTPEPLARYKNDVPDELQQVVSKLLAKEPRARFQNAGELARALQHVAANQESPEVDSAPLEAPAPQQDIRFCTAADGVRLAYSVLGAGPLLVRVLGHFTHLEMEWEWPDLRLFWERLAERHTVVRYDGRGIGLSDPYTGEFTEETRQLDLDAVLTAVGSEKAILLGISEGGWSAATYTIQHTERITHLILYGAYCRGAQARPGYDPEEDQALMTLVRKGWGRDIPAFRQLFTSQFFRDDADPGLIDHFNEMQRASADPETAARYEESCHSRGDGRDLYQQVRAPTLVIHCRDDMAISAEEGRLLASLIPGARFVLLPSGTHYFPTDREVVTKVVGAITRFLHASEG